MTPEEAAAEERAAAEVGASSLPVSGAAGVPTPGLGSQWVEKMKKKEEESQKKLREGIQKTREQEITEIRKAQNAPLKAKMEEFKRFIAGLVCSGEEEAVEKRFIALQKKTAEEAGASSLPVLGAAGVPSTSTPDEPMEVPGDEAGASSLLVTSGAAGVPSASAPDEPMERPGDEVGAGSLPVSGAAEEEAESEQDIPHAEFGADWEADFAAYQPQGHKNLCTTM